MTAVLLFLVPLLSKAEGFNPNFVFTEGPPSPEVAVFYADHGLSQVDPSLGAGCSPPPFQGVPWEQTLERACSPSSRSHLEQGSALAQQHLRKFQDLVFEKLKAKEKTPEFAACVQERKKFPATVEKLKAVVEKVRSGRLTENELGRELLRISGYGSQISWTKQQERTLCPEDRSAGVLYHPKNPAEAVVRWWSMGFALADRASLGKTLCPETPDRMPASTQTFWYEKAVEKLFVELKKPAEKSEDSFFPPLRRDPLESLISEMQSTLLKVGENGEEIDEVVSSRTGMKCYRGAVADMAECVCRGLQIQQLMTQERSDHFAAYQKKADAHLLQARKDYAQAIETSALSKKAKNFLLERLKTSARSIRVLAPQLSAKAEEANAYMDPAHKSFAINLSMLAMNSKSGDLIIRNTLAHEFGHFFEQEINDSAVQQVFTDSDWEMLLRFRDCLDQNIAHGEFINFWREGRGDLRFYSSSNKRREYLADNFLKHTLRRAVQPGEDSHFVLSIWCPPTDAGGQVHFSGSYYDRYVMAGHPDTRYRIPMVLNGITPLEGSSFEAEKPIECDKVLWR